MATDNFARLLAASKVGLEENGKISPDVLPSYVDDVEDLLVCSSEAPTEFKEGDKYYNTEDKLIYTATSDSTWDDGETPVAGKIYINTSLNPARSLRWDGEDLVEIGSDLSNYLAKDNTEAFVPTGDSYNPATAKYAESMLNAVAPIYDATSTYSKRDRVSYKGKIYECNTDISTAEAWDSSHWTETTIDEAMNVEVIRILYADSQETKIAKCQKVYDHYINNEPCEVYVYSRFSNNDYHSLPASLIYNHPNYLIVGYSNMYNDNGEGKRVEGTSISLTINNDVVTSISINSIWDILTTSYNGSGFGALTTNNTRSFTPTGDYNPATKKYVDDIAATKQDIVDEGLLKTYSADIGSMDFGTLFNNSSASKEIVRGILQRAYDLAARKVIITKSSMGNGNEDWLELVHGRFTGITNSNDIQLRFVVHNDYPIDFPRLAYYGYFVNIGIVDGIITVKGLGSGAATGGTDSWGGAQVLHLRNTKAYTPTADYNPATKKYVDDSIVAASIQYETMPNATVDTLGEVIQYIGTTTQDYTQGYFYVGASKEEEVSGATVTVYYWDRVEFAAVLTYAEESDINDIFGSQSSAVVFSTSLAGLTTLDGTETGDIPGDSGFDRMINALDGLTTLEG